MEFDNQSMTGQGIVPYHTEKLVRQPNLKERLDLAVTQAEAKLAAAKEAKEIFERNPDLERLLNIMQNNYF